MKKSFRILLTLALVFVMVLSLTACVSDCELGKHSLVDIQEVAATCTTEGQIAHKKCIVCELLFDSTGKQIKQEDTVVAKLGHQLSETAAIAPTCTNDGNVQYWECGRCDKKFEDAAGSKELTGSIVLGKLAHKNAVDVVEVAATCTTDGVKAHKKCQDCDALLLNGEVVTAADLVIAKLGHTEVVDDAVPATCTTAGLTAGKHCSVCDAVIVAQTVVPATGHTEVPLNGVPATCTTTGLTAGKECSVCDAVIVPQTEIPALGHTPVEDKAVEATCTTTGLTAGSHCSVCETVITPQTVVPAKGHTPVEDKAVEATCTTDGKTAGSHCSVCQTVLTAQTVVPALGHDYTNWTTTEAATCVSAGEKSRECQRQGCEHSETEEIAIDSTAHAWGNWSQTKAPTCTTVGTETRVCSHNGQHKETRDVAIDENAHAWGEWTQTTAPTCSEKGEETRVCAHNDEHIETREVAIDEDAHAWSEWTQTKAPTCSAKGEETRVCAHDATHVETREVAIDATAHAWGEWTQVTAPTCTTVGTETRVCSHNNEHTETRDVAIDATAHAWGEWTQITAPTCSTKGEEKRVCEHDATHVETRAIKVDENAHKWGEWTQTTAPTCSAKGEDTRVCAHNNEHTETREVAIDATAHAWGEWTQTTAPTCSAKGEDTRVCAHNDEHIETREVAIDEDAHNIAHGEAKQATCKKGETWWNAYEYCTLCDYTTKQEQAPVAHTVVVDQAVAPTCEETGLTEGSHCSVCGAVLAEQEDVDALGHNNKAVVTDPTCEQDGYTTYTCQRQGCDYSHVEVDEGSALGHNWQLKIDKQPTYTETGLSHEECSRCNAKQNENTVVEKLDHEHNYQQTVTAPTCTTDGYTTYKCTICDYTYTDNKVEKLNHNFGEWVVTTPATCENAGEKTRTCANDASHKETQSIPATGHAETSKYVVIGEKLYSVKTCECASTRKLVPADTVVEISNDADLQTVVEFGYSVKLTADINLTSALEIVGKTLTIDLNGHTLTADWASDDVVEVLFIRNNSHVIVTGNGTMISGDKSEHTNSVISCIENSTLTIENGTFISNDCGDVIYARTNSVVTILGGHFEAATAYEDGKWYILDILESEPAETRGQFIVKGGEFVNFDPANHRCDGDSYTNKLADGFHSIKDGNIYTVSAHTAGQWIVDVQAGCQTTGSKHQVCADCGATIATATIDALGHNEVAHQAQAPTCEQAGWDAYVTCSRCDYTTKVEKVALGHNWNEGEITTAPTCMVEGVKTFTCQNDHNHTKTESVAINPTAHNFSNEYTIDAEPTCTEAGSKSKHCQNEGCQEKTAVTTIPAKQHAWGEVVYTWSDDHSECTATRVCANDAAHIESETAQVAKQITQNQACGLPELATLTAYFENTAFQTQTKVDYQTKPALEHNFGEWNEEIPATCVATGTKGYKVCDRCSNNFDAEGNKLDSLVIAIDPNAHDIVDHEAKAATCTTIGWDAYETCSRCDDYTTYKEIPALGHTEVTDAAIAPTCTTAGKTEGSHCSTCNKVFVAQQDVAINPEAHSWNAGEITTAPTCSDTGIKTYTCEHNAEHTKQETLDADTVNGHDYGTPANTKIDKHTYTCSICEESYTEDHVYDPENDNKCVCGKEKPQGGGYVLVTDASTLQAGDQIVIVAQGKDKAYAMSDYNSSGTTYYKGKEITVNGDTITFDSGVTVITLGGTEGAWTFAVSETEFLGWSSSNSLINLGSNGGSNIQWKITIANNGTATILNGADNTRKLQWNASNPRFACYTSNQTAVAIYRQEAAGCEHVGTQTRDENVVPATCTEAGSKDIYCDYCDEKIRTETIEATDHSYDAGVVTAPNCTEGGYTTFTCQVEGCGHSYEDDFQNPNGHKDENPVDGTCDVCEADVCAHESKTPHAKVDATCQATGTQAHDECDVCHTLFVGEEIVTAESLVIDKAPDNHNMPITWTKATNFQHSRTCQNQGCDHVETVDCTFDQAGNCTDCDRTGVIVTIDAALAADDEKEVCLIGRVSSIVIDWSNQYNNYSINIKDAEGNEIYLYRTGGEQAKVGDLIRVVGKMGTYEGNRQVVNSTGKILEVHTECTEFTEADCLNPEICTACGKVKEDSEALGHTTENGTCERCGETINAFDPVAETIDFSTTAQRVSQTTTQQVWKNGDITFTNNKSTSQTAVSSNINPVRLYANSTITIAAPTGYNITQIVFNCNNSDSGKYVKIPTTINGTVVVQDGATFTVTLNTPANSITITLTAQVRLDSLVVTYQKACDHADTTTTTVPATCTTAGSETVKCNTCGKVVSTNQIAALGHAWNEGEVTTPASCTATGIKTYTCTRTDCEETKTETVEMVAHTPETVEGKDATCTETGLTDGQKCSVCDKELQPQVEIPATGHVDGDRDGVCDNCPEVLEKCEHTNTTTTCTATCTEAGQRITTCDDCEQQIDQEFVKALGHTPDGGSVTTPPTCTTAGVKTYTCTVCREVASTEPINATGHTAANQWTYDKDYHWKDCTACEDDVRLEEAEHDFTNGNCACGQPKPAAEPQWVKTDLANIKSTDIVVIVWTKGSNSYAMSNDKGSSAAPTGVKVTISGDKLSGEPADNIKWNITNSSGTLTIYSNGTTTKWLYCTNNNNGLRVGTGSDKTFNITSNYLYNIGQKRYIGVYTANPDVRSYTSINSNITGQTLEFYVLK